MGSRLRSSSRRGEGDPDSGSETSNQGLLEKMSQFIPAVYAVGESPASHFIKDNNLDSAKR